MSGELTKLYKVIQPVVFSVRREIGELLQLTAEEAEHLAAFIVPADQTETNASTDENSEQQSSEQNQNQDQNTDQNQTQSDQSQTDQTQNQNSQPSNTEGGQTGDQSQQQTA